MPSTSFQKLCLYTFNEIVFLSLNKKQFCRNPKQNLTCCNNYKLNEDRSDCVGEFYSLQTVQLDRLFLGCCRITEEFEKYFFNIVFTVHSTIGDNSVSSVRTEILFLLYNDEETFRFLCLSVA